MRYFLITAWLSLTFASCNHQSILTLDDNKIVVGTNVLHTSDNSYVLSGLDQKSAYHSRGWVNNGSGVVLKLDRQGRKIWENSYSFLKFSVAHNLIETKDQDLLLVNIARHDHLGGRGPDTLSYLTRLNKNGDLLDQKRISGDLRKIIETSNGDLFILGFKAQQYDEDLTTFIQQPFLLHTNAKGLTKWRKDIDIKANSIGEIKLIENVLYVSYALFTPTNTERLIMRFDLNQGHITTTQVVDAPNSLSIDKDHNAISLVNTKTEGVNNWMLDIKNENKNKDVRLSLGDYSQFQLLPQIRLKYLHVCTQLNESASDVNQISRAPNGDIFLTTLIIDDPSKATEASLSTQAYCHRNIKGFLVMKINKNDKLEWIKQIDQQAIPMNISISKDNTLMIIGTQYKGAHDGKVDPGQEKLFFMLMDDNGHQVSTQARKSKQ